MCVCGVRSRCNCVFMGLRGRRESQGDSRTRPEHRVPCGRGLQLMLSVLIKIMHSLSDSERDSKLLEASKIHGIHVISFS